VPRHPRNGGVEIDPGLHDEVVLVTGAKSPLGIGAATAQTPLRRIWLPDNVADVIVFLASHQARWITGQVIHVGGGHTI
jgi:3-oxoacyl-[acyl-carrier protein] reductase